jgi:hypothetical protein
MYSSMIAVSTSRSRGLTRASGIFPALLAASQPSLAPLPAHAQLPRTPGKLNLTLQLQEKMSKALLFNSRDFDSLLSTTAQCNPKPACNPLPMGLIAASTSNAVRE